jgi:DHA2 family multidrug resistance protein
MSAAAAAGAAPPLAGSTKAITALALAVGTFMQVLDTSIANVSVPTIAGNLGVSSDQGTWVITSFAVANGVSVPLTGWLMQRFGVVPSCCRWRYSRSRRCFAGRPGACRR